MPLAPYTTGNEVRAAIGVTEKELSDDTLDLDIYSKNLVMELDGIGDNDGALVTAFAVVDAIADTDRTALQRRFFDAVTLFAPYVVALQLETSAPLFAPKAITDGKAALTRHSESPFKDAFDRCKQYAERFRQSLEQRWAAYNTTSTEAPAAPTLFAVSTPSTDPVTG
jgi:hypothetical protein